MKIIPMPRYPMRKRGPTEKEIFSQIVISSLNLVKIFPNGTLSKNYAIGALKSFFVSYLYNVVKAV
jgi:hypothetical protein